MRDEEFEWDEDKAEKNLENHKVDFDTARKVFEGNCSPLCVGLTRGCGIVRVALG